MKETKYSKLGDWMEGSYRCPFCGKDTKRVYYQGHRRAYLWACIKCNDLDLTLYQGKKVN